MARESTLATCRVSAWRPGRLTQRQFDTLTGLQSGNFRTVEESFDAETQIVIVHGGVDLGTAQRLREALDEAAQDHKPHLIVDLSEVPFIDSPGIGALIGASEAMRARVRLIVICPDNLRRLVELARVDATLRVVGSLPEALVA